MYTLLSTLTLREFEFGISCTFRMFQRRRFDGGVPLIFRLDHHVKKGGQRKQGRRVEPSHAPGHDPGVPLIFRRFETKTMQYE